MYEFIEIQEFGANIITLTFFITLFFTILQGYALIRQSLKILKNKSGKSVSFTFFCYYSFSALAVIIYGLYKHSLALSINGLLGFIALFVVINIWRFKEISRNEKIIGLGSAIVIPLIIFLPQKDTLFLVFGSVVTWAIVSQILEIWKNKSSGSVDPGQTITSIFSSLFWLSYAIVMKIWPMEIFNSLGFILWLIMLLSYLKFKDK